MNANPQQIQQFAALNKCFMCKHRFQKPLLLPVEQPGRGRLQPDLSAEYLFHTQDTHGIEPSVVRDWVIGAVYGQELTEFGVRR